MSSSRVPLFTGALIAVLVGTNNANAKDETSQTISRGLSYVREAGVKWIDKRGCVSCHQIPTLIWSHRAALDAGHEVPERELIEWEAWSTDVVNFVKPNLKKDVVAAETMSGNIDTMTQLLLAIPEEADAAWRKQFAAALVREQRDDGSWKACGQLPVQRRPEIETTATTTMWTLLALAREAVDCDFESANAFIDQVTEAESIEYLAARTLLASQRNEAALESWQNRVLSHQNPDGGWGFRNDDETSDALGTGYALYALAATGAMDPRLSRAVHFLESTQESDGKWSVPGTKRNAKGRSTHTASDWGTAWAITALTQLAMR